MKDILKESDINKYCRQVAAIIPVMERVGEQRVNLIIFFIYIFLILILGTCANHR